MPGGLAPEQGQTGKTNMPQIDIEILTPFAAKFLEGTTLTPAERAEVLRIAQGFACKDSAAAAGVSPETIRARRKRIYRKLDVPGSGELLASLLSLSLKMLAKGERIEPRPVVPAQTQPGASMSPQQPAVIAR
jgi:DNA-binding CsgD family transcriptional regulator